ncbi:MAG: RecQ family ATP-dependent DNA helicase, partial [Clostridiales Family XIII bacterium]|nr:RecQ family ATP-dependent DNA helicase [Clostridiales Family XIII bacterium]
MRKKRNAMDVETRDAMKKDAAECTRVLKDRFGYDTFREGQAEVVDALLSGRDAVGIMPTGGGKSICYQLPALLLPGVTVVVSPLISLMADQVRSLSENGIPAAFLNSSLNPEAFCDTVRAAAAGEYRLLYVAPERLDTAPFRELARNLDVSLVAVDEAHCISQWGQNFRPSYLNIADFITQMPRRPVVSAFTATATLRVREDIVAALGLRDPLTVVSGFNRPNLYFEVTKPQNKQKELLLYVKKRAGRCGIVYCSTRKTVEAVRELLARHGVSAVRYHAGLSDAERRRNQEDFLYDRADVMVATNAFGMGIDKPDARCDNCGNCHGAFEEVDATEWMRAALNCVHQICGRGWPYGKAMVCDVLKGAVNEKVRRARLADVRTFGLLTALPQRKILDVLDALEQDGFLAVSDGRYPTLTLGPEAERAREEGFRYMLRVPKRAPDADGNADATSEDLFETLRALRRRLAEGANVPAYV